MKRSSKLKRPVPDDVLDDIPDCAIDGIQKAVAPLRGTYRQFSFHLCHPYMTGGIPDSKAYSSFGESFRTEITKSKSIIALNAEEKLDLNKRFPNLTLKDLDVLKSLSHAVRTRVEALKKYQFEHDWLHGKFLKEKAALQDSDYNALCRRKKLLKQKARLDGPDYKTLCHQSKLDELGEEFIEKRAALVDKYHDLYQPLYTKRYDIVNGIVDVEGALNEASDRTKEDESSTKEKERGVPDFWLTAFKNKMVIFGNISKHDEEALKYLRDVKYSRIDDPNGFKLEFMFATNPFFKNEVLTKVYHITDEDKPTEAIGTEIEWYPENRLTMKIVEKKSKMGSKKTKASISAEQCESFFNYFSPSQVPKDDDIAEFQNLMVKDYNIGVIIRDEIIPRAVLWFIVKGADELTENDFSDFDEADDVDVDVDDDDDDGDDDVGDDDDDDDNDYDDDFDYGLPTDITKKSRKGAARKRTARK